MARKYITTSIVYTNTPPHIGFALELIQADAIARFWRAQGHDVRFGTGTDEHGTNIYRAAQVAGVPTQDFVDEIAGKVKDLADKLNISYNQFIRTSDRAHHWPAAEKLWRAIVASGDLYKKKYEGLYCVGHEAFIRSSDLVDGKCPLHAKAPELVSEENWFFKITKYRDQVRELIESGKMEIMPKSRASEILNLLDDIEDVSFSRPSDQLPWGIPAPDDPTQTMYVWADALTNYLSGLGYGTDNAQMDFWPADIHLVGKDIVRFHAIIWPAMLLSAGLKIPRRIAVHGFITVDGKKMSKTIGNVIDPFDILAKWPMDVVRYFMLREIQSTDDSDFALERLKERYDGELANGLGNLVQRVAVLMARAGDKIQQEGDLEATEASLVRVLDDTTYNEAFESFRLHDVVGAIWEKIGIANAYINTKGPWKQDDAACANTLAVLVEMIKHIAVLLAPIMPETAEKIAVLYGAEIKKAPEPLFPKDIVG